ncbi:MAG: EscU/YscU/HrcU family type III secretion system export apparatus switch protein [Acetobacteraceae bacterium]|nr:EscU/YscU/HrcU family type III secretion system export apparatus switch protein [Acetobacteraceae bacterium]
MAEADAEDRTQAASARRLEQARAQGDVPLSSEVPGVAGLGGAILVFMLGASTGLHSFGAHLARMLTEPESTDVALRGAVWTALALLLPFVAAVAAASAASTLAQTRFLFHLGALRPDLARLDPRRGLRRIGGRETLVQAGRAILKLGILGWAAWHALSGIVPDTGQALLELPDNLLDRIARGLLHLALLVLGAQAVFAVLDLVLVRLRYARRMRMSREGQREETKESEGDPRMKARLRRLRAARARRRMMTAVPTATVVITNPTHYAVALRYDQDKGGAPRVVAKGVDEIAARIRAVAEENRVPLVTNPPLARTLYTVELDREIPAEHFQAVAEVIAYVWRLRGRVRRAGT